MQVQIKIVGTLLGVNMMVSCGPTRTDPYGEGTNQIAYGNLDEALADIPAQVEQLIAEVQGAE